MTMARAEMVGRLHALVAQLGPAGVASALGVEDEFVLSVMAGVAVLDGECMERFVLICESMEGVVEWNAGMVGAMAAGRALAAEEEAGLDFDEEAGVEVGEGVYYNPMVGMVSDFTEIAEESPVAVMAPGATRAEQDAKKLENLWAARDLALMTQFSLGPDETELLYAMGTVNEIELALIMMFRQSVPDRNRHWDEFRRQKEIYIRMVRKNRIERDLKRENSGFKGLLKRIRGEKPLNSRDLFSRLTAYVDDMSWFMEDGRVGKNALQGVRELMDGGPRMGSLD